MTNYFELYKEILLTINNASPETGHELIDALSESEYIIREKDTNPNLINDTLKTLDNLLDDGLVNGKRTATKSIPIYMISGLSSKGHKYLLEMTNKSFSDKVKSFLKENGLPLTPQAVSKFLFQLIFK